MATGHEVERDVVDALASAGAELADLHRDALDELELLCGAAERLSANEGWTRYPLRAELRAAAERARHYLSGQEDR